MSGSEKLPAFERLHSDLRYFNRPPFSSLSGAPAVAQARHPFIAHIYPWVAETERHNRGLNRFDGSISHTAPASALVALAASGYVDKDLSHILHNFQKQKQTFESKFDVKKGVGSELRLSGESPPKKKNLSQSDVDVLPTNIPPTPSSSHVNSFSEHTSHQGFAAFGTPHLHSAWQQLLFRFRSFENSFDPSSSRSEFLPNFGITRNSSDFSNRVLSETGRRLHFPTSPTSLVGTPSSKAMPSANEVESDVFLRDKTPTSSSDRLKSSCDNSELEDRKDHVTIKKLNSSVNDDEKISNSYFSNKERKRKLSSNQFENIEVFSHDSPILANRRLSSSSDQSRDGQQKRKRKRKGSLKDTCPICGVTVRPCDLARHLMQEIENIAPLTSETRKKYLNESTANKKVKKLSTATNSACSNGKKISEAHRKSDRSKRFKTFEKVRSNRLERLNTRVGQCLRAQQGPDVPHLADSVGWRSSTPWSTHLTLPANCPLCCSRLTGSESAMHKHISRCLRLRNVRQQLDDKDEVDVDVNVTGKSLDDGSGTSAVESDWSRRMRSLVDSSSPTSGSLFVRQQRALEAEAEQDLNVDGDDAQIFGPPQYIEEDLREKSRDCDKSVVDDEDKRSASNDSDASSSGNEIAALRSKVEKLEDEIRSTRCMICMETYKDPVTSVQCWHVHCEKCWLQVLALKKLCPQCSMITTPSKLRRIYL